MSKNPHDQPRFSFDSISPGYQHPSDSRHWKSLSHNENDVLISDSEALCAVLRQNLEHLGDNVDGELVAIWSTIVGYCEALSTNKDEAKKFNIFPIPLDALKRLVQDEFREFLGKVSAPSPFNHRNMVRELSNAIWARAIPKSTVQDEIHANSIYAFLRGQIDKRSLDCFGSALTTVIGMNMLGHSSKLTLSEDHAYECHHGPDQKLETCEVAIPGNTKLARSKRGKDIVSTFADKQGLTADSSWLYMASNPVVCDSSRMTMAAVFGNINCTIEKCQGSTISSAQLYELKRDLLWVLHDYGCMDKFPFGLIELGDCEEQRGSARSLIWVKVKGVGEPILMNEKLYVDAIRINETIYNDAQTYPYFYAAHYHKDAGRSHSDQEYRLGESLRLYAMAARAASRYHYHHRDSMHLNKHFTSIGGLIAEDILSEKGQPPTVPRSWIKHENAVACAGWLLVFFDFLMIWEEQSSGKRFVEILNPSHKHGLARLWSLFSQTVRQESLDSQQMSLRSLRMSRTGLLWPVLAKPKVAIAEMHLTIAHPDEDGAGRRSKRRRS